MTDQIVVDVVILTWNDGPLLGEAIRSVRESRDVRTNVIVVDNGSEPPVVLSTDDVTLIRNDDNLGVATGRNQGIQRGTAPFICILDSDAYLEPSALRRLAAPLIADSSIGVSVPVYVGQSPTASAGRRPTGIRKLMRAFNVTAEYAAGPNCGVDPWWDVDFGIGACQFFRRVAFEAVGGIDDSIFYGPEDVDFCLRVHDAGWRVVQVAEARVRHPPRRRFRWKLDRRTVGHAWAVLRYLWRYRGAAPHRGGRVAP